MTVAGRAPDLNSCILRTISSRGLPASDSTSPTLTPPVPWQLAQDAARLRAAFASPTCAIATVAPSTAIATPAAMEDVRTKPPWRDRAGRGALLRGYGSPANVCTVEGRCQVRRNVPER